MEPLRPRRIPTEEKIVLICSHLESLNMTPKSFIIAFLTHSNMNAAFRRRFWSTETGWNSTEQLLEAIKSVVCNHSEGAGHWKSFVLSEVSLIYPY